MFDSAVENAIILKNPVTKSVKLPKPVEKKTKVLTIDEQEKFMEEAEGSSNYPQYFFILQTPFISTLRGHCSYSETVSLLRYLYYPQCHRY